MPCRYGGEVFFLVRHLHPCGFWKRLLHFRRAGHSCASSPVVSASGFWLLMGIVCLFVAGLSWFFFCGFAMLVCRAGDLASLAGVFFSSCLTESVVSLSFSPSCLRPSVLRGVFHSSFHGWCRNSTRFRAVSFVREYSWYFSAFCPWSFVHASFYCFFGLVVVASCVVPGGFFVLRQCQHSHSEVWWRSHSISWSGG